ncbi:MAG: HAD family hydrolase [Candidatus Thermoplasmatota archaeon]
MKPTISFDLDGTLVDRSYPDAVWLQGLPRIYAKEKNIPFHTAQTFLIKEYDAVGDTNPEWYDIHYWFSRFNLTTSWQDLLDEYRHTIQVFPEVPDILRRLSKDYNLILLSNAKREFIDIELEQSKLGQYFTYVFSSTSDFHQVKKVPLFYEKICEEIKVKPDELIHVGDHEEFDYKVPSQLGIKSFFLDRTRTATGNHVVYDLTEFESKITCF